MQNMHNLSAQIKNKNWRMLQIYARSICQAYVRVDIRLWADFCWNFVCYSTKR